MNNFIIICSTDTTLISLTVFVKNIFFNMKSSLSEAVFNWPRGTSLTS